MGYSVRYHSSWEYFRGGKFKPITVAKLKSIPTTVRVSQGGLSTGVKASAGSHDGIGAFDLSIRGLSKAQVWKLCIELLEVNIIPCIRGVGYYDSFQGRSLSNIHDGNEHIHCLDLDARSNMSGLAKSQCSEVLNGGDGLRGSHKFYGPSLKHRVSWSKSKWNPKNRRVFKRPTKPISAKPGVYAVDGHKTKGKEAVGYTSSGKRRNSRKPGVQLRFVKIVYMNFGHGYAVYGVTRLKTYFRLFYFRPIKK